jgi:hypothetical protein
MLAFIRTESWDVARRLADFGMTREQLLEVIRACASGAGNVTENDPPGTHGWETYRFGVRRLREELRPDGWEPDNTDGLATITNAQLKMRIAVANTNDATGILDRTRFPQNRNKKGPTAERAAETNQALLPGVDWPAVTKLRGDVIDIDDLVTWYLCIYVNGDDVRAELSLLDKVEDGWFTDWKERIIILKPGDWKNVEMPSEEDDLGPELEIDVRPR